MFAVADLGNLCGTWELSALIWIKWGRTKSCFLAEYEKCQLAFGQSLDCPFLSGSRGTGYSSELLVKECGEVVKWMWLHNGDEESVKCRVPSLQMQDWDLVKIMVQHCGLVKMVRDLHRYCIQRLTDQQNILRPIYKTQHLAGFCCCHTKMPSKQTELTILTGSHIRMNQTIQ